MSAKALDEWGGWGGNLRRPDLTWRRSRLPWGHELSLTAGVIMLFPGPLARVTQWRWVRGANRNRVWFVFAYHTDNPSSRHSLLPLLLFIIYTRVSDQCSIPPQEDDIFVCVHMLYTHRHTLPQSFFSPVNPTSWSDRMALYFHSASYIYAVWFLGHSFSSLSAHVLHNPSLYGVLSRLRLRLSSVSISPSSQRRNPTRRVWMFVSCLFVQ